MGSTTRHAVISFDDVRAASRMGMPEVATLLVSWSRTHLRAAVMGGLDDSGSVVELTAEQLARLTSLLRHPMPPEAIRMSYPDAEASGSVMLHVDVDEPGWARVGDKVAELVRAGEYVTDEQIQDAIWLVLEGLGLPNSVLLVRRVDPEPEWETDPLFRPVELWDRFDGSGRKLSWQDALDLLPKEIERPLLEDRVAVLASELVERIERHQSQKAGTEVRLPEHAIRL